MKLSRASQFNLAAVSSLGKCPRVLMTRRNPAFTPSIASVSLVFRPALRGKAKNGVTLSQSLRQAPTRVENLWPQASASNAFSANMAASALTALWIDLMVAAGALRSFQFEGVQLVAE